MTARHTCSHLIIPALLALVTGATAAESAPATDTAVPSDPVKAFTVKPNRLSINLNLNFQDGDPSDVNINSSASLGLRVSWKRPVMCVGQGDEVRWSEIVTDTGENLLPDERENGNRYDNDTGNRRETWVNAQFKAPLKPANAIARISGTIPMRCEIGKAKPLDFTPIKDWIGKSQTIPGTDYAVTILACSGTKVKYRYPTAARSRMRDIVILDVDGTKLEGNRSSGSGDQTSQTTERTFEEDIPLDGTLRVPVVGETTLVQVPFSFSNIPLNEAPPQPAPKF